MAKKDKNMPTEGQPEGGGSALSKDIDVEAIKEKLANIGKKKSKLPEKTVMNLAFKEKGDDSKNADIAMIVVTIIILIVFAKFGVLDIYNEKQAEIAKRDEAQQQLESDQALLARYADLQDKYSHYYYAFLTDEELAIVNRVELFQMLEENLFSVAGMKSVSVNENIVNISFDGVTLEQVGQLAEKLEANEMVENVDVRTTTSTIENSGVEKPLQANIVIEVKNEWLENATDDDNGGEGAQS